MALNFNDFLDEDNHCLNLRRDKLATNIDKADLEALIEFLNNHPRDSIDTIDLTGHELPSEFQELSKTLLEMNYKLVYDRNNEKSPAYSALPPKCHLPSAHQLFPHADTTSDSERDLCQTFFGKSLRSRANSACVPSSSSSPPSLPFSPFLSSPIIEEQTSPIAKQKKRVRRTPPTTPLAFRKGKSPIVDAGSLKDKTILIVEDNPGILKSLVDILMRKTGATIISATDGKSALQKIEENPEIFCIITDWNMEGLNNGMNGDELIKILHEQKNTIPIVLNSDEHPEKLARLKKEYPHIIVCSQKGKVYEIIDYLLAQLPQEKKEEGEKKAREMTPFQLDPRTEEEEPEMIPLQLDPCEKEQPSCSSLAP